MNARTVLSASLLVLTLGAGCFGFGGKRDTRFTPAAPQADVLVPPNQAGAEASIGGHETTVTPSLPTERLVSSLPEAASLGYKGSEAAESKHPIPLPDGTRDEYVSVERTYVKDGGTEQEIRVHIMLSDTRSVPVVTAFVKNFSEFSNADGYRKRSTIEGTDAWILYTYDPAKQQNGFGGLTMLYRNRFLIQIDGSLGVTEQGLQAFAEGFDFSQLR